MKTTILLVFLGFFQTLNAQKLKVYLIPGHGSDYRVFSKFETGEYLDTTHVFLLMPEKNESIHSYSKRMAGQIDTTKPFAIVGLSLGGMVAAEMSTFLCPETVIIISSADSENEIPLKFRWMQTIPVYKILSGWFYKGMSSTAQKLFEPDRKKESDIFDSMLKDKDPEFIKRAINLVVNFKSDSTRNCPLIHIHGDNDHTIPIKNITADHVIEGGSHMMLLTESEKISLIIRTELEKLLIH